MNQLTPLRFLLISALLPFASFAQEVITPPKVVPAPGIAPETELLPANPPVEEPVDPADQLADKLLELKIDRSPAAIINSLRENDEADQKDPVILFQRAAMFGDWKSVGETLATLPPAKAQKIYTQLITSIAKQAVGVGTLLSEPEKPSPNENPYEVRRRLSQQNESLSESPAPVLSEDFFGLIEASPGPLTAEHLPSIAKIANVALGADGRPSLVARLRTGWKGLGGESPAEALLAASLLSELGWIRDAAPFLPLEESQWDQVDRDALILTMRYFTTMGIEDRDERLLNQAAALSAHIMKSSRIGNYTRPQFRTAMQGLVALLPALEPAAAQKLIREQLFTQKSSLTDLINIFGEKGRQAQAQDDLQARVASLGTQRLILEALTSMEEPLPSNIALLTLNWLSEAEACYRAGGVIPAEMSQADRMMLRRYGFDDGQKVKTLSTEQVLATSPPAELIPRLNPGLAQRVKLTMLKLKVLAADSLDLTQVRAYAKDHPGLERQICQDILAAWVSKQTKPAENERVKQLRAYGINLPAQLANSGQNIPLTRLRQNQNISELKTLLAELREISPEPLDPALIIEAFMALHSGAEVYQLDDITGIFGPPESMVRGELLNLLESMRSRLGEEWRDPATQQQASTNRTEDEMNDEVSRGYRTALEIAKRGIPDNDDDWRALITRGRLFYDASQYEFDREIQLTEYVNMRDEAFASFRRAAETYAAKLPTMPKGQWTIEPHQAWFFVMLGASDLAQLTSNAARTDPGLQIIGDALRALPGEAADQHLNMFGQMLGNTFPRVPANARQRFLSAGLKIIGEDHPAAAAATRSLDYYRELLDEIQLRVTIDGPTEVGHGEPFGLFIGLESTRQLLRESGGFGKYLSSPTNQRGMMMGGNPGSDLRGNFEKNIHAALEETFEIVAIRFHDSAVRPIPLPREGWMDTPLAYLVLRAKNPAVDRIPSIQLDMDFIDQAGQVVLPVMSQVQPLDARPDSVAPRPCPELALELTVDERDWPNGIITIEINASGQGLIAELADYFDYQQAGFEVEVVDRTLAITEFISDGTSRAPRADRNWQLTYRRQADLEQVTQFNLPTTLEPAQSANLTYQLYRDSDLLTLTPEEAAKGLALSTPGVSQFKNWLYAAAAVLALLFILWLIFRTRKPRIATAPGLVPPTDPTPFSTVAFLRRLSQQFGEQLTPQDHQSIQSQIHEIETTCFAPEPQNPNPDLPKIIKKWHHHTKRLA